MRPDRVVVVAPQSQLTPRIVQAVEYLLVQKFVSEAAIKAFDESILLGFAAEGFERRPWKSTEPVRKIVNTAFTRAKLDAFGPHSFRHMLARHAAKTCTSVAEIVATSQNPGLTDVLTTLRSYGQISRERQRALITGESGDDVLDD